MTELETMMLLIEREYEQTELKKYKPKPPYTHCRTLLTTGSFVGYDCNGPTLLRAPKLDSIYSNMSHLGYSGPLSLVRPKLLFIEKVSSVTSVAPTHRTHY